MCIKNVKHNYVYIYIFIYIGDSKYTQVPESMRSRVSQGLKVGLPTPRRRSRLSPKQCVSFPGERNDGKLTWEYPLVSMSHWAPGNGAELIKYQYS